jgi:1,2-dihydroxy-3-keto-5-methylthiopentene dioxygenase
LSIYRHDASTPARQEQHAELITSDAEQIQQACWPAVASASSAGRPEAELPAGASPEQILAAYSSEIARVQAGGAYPTVDAIRLAPNHPDRDALRQKFLAEHTHSEDEVRFFVEGRGLFCLHLGDEVLQLICEAGDWIAVPAGTRHWFDMGPEPQLLRPALLPQPRWLGGRSSAATRSPRRATRCSIKLGVAIASRLSLTGQLPLTSDAPSAHLFFAHIVCPTTTIRPAKRPTP